MHLKRNPHDPHWPDRDRFVLSNGHGSMLIYALLHLTGYTLRMAELKNFRQLHSKTAGHPEVGVTPGVETTTGPLGQGITNAVGTALAEKLLAADTAVAAHAKAETVASRKASQISLESFTAALPEMLGGSADLTGSNLTNTKATAPLRFDLAGDVKRTDDGKIGRHINYAVREFGMAATSRTAAPSSPSATTAATRSAWRR